MRRSDGSSPPPHQLPPHAPAPRVMDGPALQLSPRSSDRPAVLITDDDAALRETLRATLEPCGVDTLLAGDGLEAVEIVRSATVHLAVFDMHMPRLTGLDAMLRLQAMGLDLPCILISAKIDASLREAAGRANAYSLLPKPISRVELTTSVCRALASRYRWTAPNN